MPVKKIRRHNRNRYIRPKPWENKIKKDDNKKEEKSKEK